MTRKYFLVLLVSVILSSFKGETSTAISNDSTFSVKVDKRIELYFVTAYMSDSFFKKWLTINDADYARELENYFADFKSHPAITFFEETWKPDMSTYIPPEIMIYLSSSIEEQKELKIPKEIVDHIGGKDKKDEFIKQIRDFSKASNYDEFYKLHQDYYTSLSSKVLKLLKKKNCIPKLNEFYGIEHNHYYVLLVPFLGPGNGYGPSIESEDGKKDVFCLLSPYQDDEQIINMLWHEFGHSFVNPLVAKNLMKVNERKDLYDPISSSMQPLYSDWENSLSEHLVRVNTTELIRSEYGKRTAKQKMHAHESQGFIYMKPLTSLIEDYVSNRSSFPTFEAFFPQILDKLKSMNASDYIVKKEVEQIDWEKMKTEGPQIIEISPKNGSENVDPSVSEIRIKFDRKMQKGCAVIKGSTENFPEINGSVQFEEDNSICVLPVKLKANCNYYLEFNNFKYPNFRDEKGRPLYPIIYKFSTGE